ncbi:hypothetical protein BC936DRAFT_140034 [Jimgerdemannia flammicorona]|uniref:Uncharacterized protein n=1 Tax=Jimgerdemannia flammicorona TaxID=994334 RepID=A0A433B444_9FUNG|nr:hypothetical protein BC936DRAFT_140034 [Jimgerdemannia flammicorona]
MIADSPAFLYLPNASPKEYTFGDIHELARDIIKKPLPTYPIPKFAAKLVATLLDKLPAAMLSPDQIERVSNGCDAKWDGMRSIGVLYINDTIHSDAHTFADLYIEPGNLDALAIAFIRRFRSTAYFDLPVEKSDGKIEKGVYHVID